MNHPHLFLISHFRKCHIIIVITTTIICSRDREGIEVVIRGRGKIEHKITSITITRTITITIIISTILIIIATIITIGVILETILDIILGITIVVGIAHKTTTSTTTAEEDTITTTTGEDTTTGSPISQHSQNSTPTIPHP